MRTDDATALVVFALLAVTVVSTTAWLFSQTH